MRKFTDSDFTWSEGDVLVSEASTLGFPLGRALPEFEVKGLGAFELQSISRDEHGPTHWIYINGKGIIAQIFND
jgi:hypothetical protein